MGDTLYRQSEIDSFPILYPGCKVVEGNLLLRGPDIHNLAGLASVEHVRGELKFVETSIESLEGLDSLKYVDGLLNLFVNNSIKTLHGLTSIKKIGKIYISFCDELTGDGRPLVVPHTNGLVLLITKRIKKVSDIVRIDTLVYNIYFHYNDSLQVVDGFTPFDSLTQVELNANPLLTDISGLLGVRQIRDLDIRNNQSLPNLHGLDSLEAIHFFANISGGDSLRDISALSKLGYVDCPFYINNNRVLGNLDGLENLKWISDLFYIGVNTGLKSIEGLRSLESIGGDFTLEASPLVESLTGLENLDTVGGTMKIQNLYRLKELTALDSIEHIDKGLRLRNLANALALPGFVFPLHIDGNLIIQGNDSLQSLHGLDSIKSIEGQLIINDNPFIEDLLSLQNMNVDSLDTVMIYQNEMLSLCNVNSICQFLSTGNYSNIFENLTGCNSIEEILGQCVVPTRDPLAFENLALYPNPSSGIISIGGTDNENLFIRIFDSQGRHLESVIGDTKTLDLTDLPSGMYFISVRSEQEAILKKVQKL